MRSLLDYHDNLYLQYKSGQLSEELFQTCTVSIACSLLTYDAIDEAAALVSSLTEGFLNQEHDQATADIIIKLANLLVEKGVVSDDDTDLVSVVKVSGGMVS